MRLLAIAVGLCLIGSGGGLLVASSLVFFPQRIRSRAVPWLVSYAVGTLLGVALIDLLPEALQQLSPVSVFRALLVGILAFFVLEKLVLLHHHCHTDDCETHAPSDVHRSYQRNADCYVTKVTGLEAFTQEIRVVEALLPH